MCGGCAVLLCVYVGGMVNVLFMGTSFLGGQYAFRGTNVADNHCAI